MSQKTLQTGKFYTLQVRILIALHPTQFHSVITLVTKNETECAILIRNLTTGMLYVMC